MQGIAQFLVCAILDIALTDMVESNDISMDRAKEIATMVMRSNAANLYHLRLSSENSE